MIQRVFVKVLDYARLEHLPNCGECSQGNLSMPCTDFVSKIRSVSGGSASGHRSQKCIVGAIDGLITTASGQKYSHLLLSFLH